MQRKFTYYTRVFGCQMNVADIDDLCARLAAHGGIVVETVDEAQLVLINTCTVRQKAEDKALSFFGSLKRLKSAAGGRNAPFVVAMGCVIPRARAHIEATFPYIDLLLDSSDPGVVFDALLERFPPLNGDVACQEYPPLLAAEHARQNFVTAIRGCDHKCSYCIVPYVRGKQRDVPLPQIVEEAQAWQRAGAPDITVLGQNILAYGQSSGSEHPRFCELMETLLKQTAFPWITYLTSLPGDLTEEVCERVIAHPRITPLLHLPVQSGSDKVLQDMQRGYDAAYYRRIVAKARAVRPDLYLTTDLLVGFPTETDEDYAATLALVNEIGFDDAFMFAYSPRPGTHAALNFAESLSLKEKRARLNDLISRQRQIAASRNERYLGQELEVIVEQQSKTGAVTRTAFNKPVYLQELKTPIGRYTRVRITGVKTSSFSGEEVQATGP